MNEVTTYPNASNDTIVSINPSEVKGRISLNKANKKARDHYNEIVTCNQVMVDKEERIVKDEKGNDIRARKSTFNTLEHGWIDSYTETCAGFAESINEFTHGMQFNPPIHIEFYPTVTKRNEEIGRESDAVRLAE